MKYLAILALALTPLAGLAASLSIPAGKTYVVGIDQQELVLENLRIGDGARITFSSAVAGWRVQARHAYIGNGVVIEGSGSAGAAGAPGESASTCADGMAGEHGGGGSDGVEIRLQLGIESLGDMQILANGGNGGDGGAGGDGADAAACNGDFTGNGGDGGEGGEGGRGGDVTVLYKVLAKGVSGDDLIQRIRISNEGGAGGNGGDAGSGGAGTSGRFVHKRSLTGNRAWVAGSDGGLAGSPGLAGSAGNPGRKLLDQLILSSEQPVEAKSSAAMISELQRQIEHLRARVEKLDEKDAE